MKKKPLLYPCAEQLENARRNARATHTRKRDDNAPDFIGGAPNYEKFTGWDAEKVLAWLNID